VADFPHMWLRVVLGPDTVFGPGKAELLLSIDETGSIAAASRRMGMSYKRAWYLIDTLNAYFKNRSWFPPKAVPRAAALH
jgi:molybdate transport system regulatory protein